MAALHRLPEPTSCVLWREPERLRDLRMETVTVFEEDEHFRRALLKCPECGQLYFYEMHEEVDFENGQDPVTRLYTPVPTGEHAAALSLAASPSLQRVRPILRDVWPADQKTSTIAWWRVQAGN
ncbi:hypothetical protein [Rhizomicrobium electricum]|uniref:CpXC domain-containing protein n=1 Tax=Rhizomicrobium electricum TaxID=480070 RepID=A0ABN1E9G6_9PROT|nr:hypothetical protein [Rhizomicrobium electricum]NIJ47873.1 hypothetical protein [Rhizomicrobium electricum]